MKPLFPGLGRAASFGFETASEPIRFSFSGTYRICIVVVGKIYESPSVGFCFTDRDFTPASEPSRFSFSEKEKLRKRKTARGIPP